MGNCTSRFKKKMKVDSSSDDANTANAKPSEDVTYATIDHSSAEGSRRPKAAPVDCDYAMVYIPPALQCQPESETSSKGDCDDDYVPMG